MSTCAVMLVKDEGDIIEATIRHLLTQVDRIIVADNLSTDGTRAILDTFQLGGAPVEVLDDPEVGYRQSEKTTRLARLALDQGFDWVVPCDADEVWYAPDGRPLTDWLAGVAPDVQIVRAALYNHIPSAEDSENPNPLERIGWRQRHHMSLPKVCARCRPDLEIHMGNHGASTSGTGMAVDGLVIRHFSWRTVDQYVHKIRNGVVAYEQSGLPETYGEHWRMWANATDEAVADHFRTWFWSSNPRGDATLIYDPAPARS